MTTKERKANKLLGETSTYLQQHAYNPVQWYPWGEEAIARARKENKPILLSVGYAACHWCHVMEHESFEDDETSDLMNAYFINIKVDREERTDIDEIYMKAVQMMTGHGGWPMTVFLTPDLKPFFGGTYFPKENRHGMPAFKKVLAQIQAAWKNHKDDLLSSAEELTEHIKLTERVKEDGTSDKEEEELARRDSYLNYGTISSALEKMLRNFDSTFGGFGGAPKFPHTFALELALRSIHRGSQIQESKKAECSELIETTLNGMAKGGIQDHLAGGFARYSVDRKWLVPHFEKMLYDNALLTRIYLDGHQLTGNHYWLKVAKDILKFVKNELSTAEDGGKEKYAAFYSSLDADSEGEEGKYYVFTKKELLDILGQADGQWLSQIYGVSEDGNFEHGTSVLHLDKIPPRAQSEFWQKLEDLSQRLLQVRLKRVHPRRDEKVLTSWNSLMISAYVQGFQVTGESSYKETAISAMRFILEKLTCDNGQKLLRVWGRSAENKDGISKLDGYLDDYAFAVAALLDLASIDADPLWLTKACQFARDMLNKFADGDGGFYYTAKDHESLIVRPRSHFDGSIPSGTSVATMSLFRLAYLTGDKDFDQAARAVMRLYAPNLTRLSDQFANLLNCLDFDLSAPREIAVVLPDTMSNEVESQWHNTLKTLMSRYSPAKVVALARESETEKMPGALFKNRTCIDGQPTIYVCRNFACQKPITSHEELKAEIQNW